MKRTGVRVGLILCVVVVAVAVILLWPAPDPLADVDTVAVRSGSARPAGVDVDAELDVLLGDRNIRIVTDEAEADVVLEIKEFTVNLGDIEISISDGSFRGRAQAVCTLSDVRTGDTHVMDFIIQVENGQVRADLVPRRFWQFWKPRPSQ